MKYFIRRSSNKGLHHHIKTRLKDCGCCFNTDSNCLVMVRNNKIVRVNGEKVRMRTKEAMVGETIPDISGNSFLIHSHDGWYEFPGRLFISPGYMIYKENKNTRYEIDMILNINEWNYEQSP